MKLGIHYSFWLLAFVFLFSGLYMELLLFLIVIILHECGHLTFCILFKQDVKKISLSAVGGLLAVKFKNARAWELFLIYSGGIMINALLIFLALMIKDYQYSKVFINYNIIFIIFNILPIHPLDGYKILELLLGLINKPFLEQKVLSYISFITLFLIFYYSIRIASFGLLIIALYLLIVNCIYHFNSRNKAIKKYIERYLKQVNG